MLYPAELRARGKTNFDHDIGVAREGQAVLVRRSKRRELGFGCLGGGWSRGRVRDGQADERHLFDEVQAGAAEHLVDDCFGEAAGVVLDADGLFSLAKVEVADAVDLPEAGDGYHGGLGGGDAVAVEDIQLGHGAMIAAVLGR